MNEPVAPEPSRSRISGPMVLLLAALALMVLGPASLEFLAGRAGGVEWLRTLPHGASADPELKSGDCRIVRLERDWTGTTPEDADLIRIASLLTSYQFSLAIIIAALMALVYYPLVPILRRLIFAKIASILVAAEMLLVCWLVYGGLASMGMPGLFWNEGIFTEVMASLGVTLFGFWMLYLLFIRDFEAHRHAPGRQAWASLLPVLERSGFLRFLGARADGVTPESQLRWFLRYAGVPMLALMALPALLPALRPLKVDTVVEWPWLAGMGLGVLVIMAVVRTRAATRLHVLWHQLLRRRLNLRNLLDLDPARLDPHANIRNIWLLITAIFLVSYAPYLEKHRLSPAAFSLCIMLGVVATFATWLSMMKWWSRSLIVAGVLTLLALSGGLEYEVVVDDLAPWYPSAPRQLWRRLDPERRRPAHYGMVVDLAEHQRAEDRETAAGLSPDRAERAKMAREAILERWRETRKAEGDEKPILVVVTTSGGALRAAIWTEAVLKSLERAIPEFPRHIRLITGASGGMLGAADYVGALAGAKDGTTGTGDIVKDIKIGSDYLTPIAWQIAFRDFFPNSLFPWPSYNRGQVLQDAWCQNSPRLAMTFGQLRADEVAGRIPSIVFSPMLVEDGRRLLISNLPLRDLTRRGGDAILTGNRDELIRLESDPDPTKPPPDAYALEYPETASVSAVEFFDLLGRDSREKLRLASAVRMSATFPYVTSAVVIPTDPPRHVVDAGYYDNYGVNLASSWLASHSDWIKAHTAGVLVVQIRAFRNEKRLKLLDVEIHTPPRPPEVGGRLSRWLKAAARAVHFLPEFVSLVREGVESMVIPVEGVAKARESSMFFRNDEQLFVLQDLFRVLGRGHDPEFFRTVIFTCDTLQFGQASQNLETLNWYIDTQEYTKICRNMEYLSEDQQTGRDRNALRLDDVKRWWVSRQAMGRRVGKVQ